MSTEEELALSFEPQAIRDHFDGDDDNRSEWIANATDEQLREVALECLSGDVIYNAFHESLRLAVDDRL